jgi:bifunctional UDP-N-acetylglucosamine pyrophosphorylase/glucosamine-1-phosphate N-acetyltransferase
MEVSMKTACVILAAGMGKRMRSELPKVLHNVCGEPMLSYPVTLALSRGYDPVVVVIGKRGDAVRSFLDERFGGRVRTVVQDPPSGTGHAVLCARAELKDHRGKLVILYGDVPLLTNRELGVLESAGRNTTVAFLTCRLDDPASYGRVIRSERGEVLRIIEHADATRAERAVKEINAGIYVVDSKFAFSTLAGQDKGNAQGEYYLTDLVATACGKGLGVRGIEVPDVENLLGANDRRELARLETIMNGRLIERIMLNGVTVIDPVSTHVGPRVRVGADSMIFPGCQIQGTVHIGKGCRIGPGAVISNAWIGDRVEIRAYSVLEDCRVGVGSLVGPFARLRPGTELLSDVQIGNFVEVKKSRIGKGSKANHLTYLGDSTIGAGVNVGAGTITCNYDGVGKYPTIIEDGVFIGSDTQLVAPVRIRKGAYIGAGTTVTADVPSQALAITRVPQRHIQDYAKRKQRLKKKTLPKT